MKLASALLAIAALAAPGAVLAHHGWANQDETKVTVLEGPIQAVRYQNPHAEIELTQANQRWLITLAPVQRMQDRGATEKLLKVGQTVRVEGHKSLTPGRYEIKANNISIAGGEKINLRR
jgi:hypothetical protein